MTVYPTNVLDKVLNYLVSLPKEIDGSIDIIYEEHIDRLGVSEWDLAKILRELEALGKIKRFGYLEGAIVSLR